MKRITFEEYQKYVLEIYKKVKKALDLLSVDFIAVGGTALGTLRHGGFIPWDDDIDIMVRFDQYEDKREQFKTIIEDSNLTLLDYINEDTVTLSKIFLNEKFEIKHKGELFKAKPFLDIFIGVPKNNWTEEEIRIDSRKIIENKSLKKVFSKNKVRLFLLKILLQNIKFKKSNKKWREKYFIQGDWTKTLYPTQQASVGKSFDITSIKEMKFEDTTMYVSSSTDESLNRIFGDWAKEVIYPTHIEDKNTIESYEVLLK